MRRVTRLEGVSVYMRIRIFSKVCEVVCVCVWVGFLKGMGGGARLGAVRVSERPANETHPAYFK